MDQSNLNRQILHDDRDIGRKKTASAEEKLREINPDITVNVIDATIEESNTAHLVGRADGIVDAMDNYPTRYLLNDIALAKKIPLFHGAIQGFYGQATTIIPGKTACLRCIFPNPPPKEVFPVVGVTPGVIGTIQATEVLKYVLGNGELLANRLLIWDGMQAHAEEIVVARNPCMHVVRHEENKNKSCRNKKRNDGEEEMTVKIRFFARFRELFGTDVVTEVQNGTSFTDLVKRIAEKNAEGYEAIFDDKGSFREFVILMKNGMRIDCADAATTPVADGDEIAVFPPVAGG